MPALHELQRRVMAALLHPTDPQAQADAAALLRPTPGALDAARRLQLYRNNLSESLTAALAAVVPVVQQLVGEAFFRAMAQRFIRRFPSRHGNLHAFGAELPRFLRDFEPAASLPCLPDLAALEWAVHAVYHEAPVPALTLQALAALDAGAQAALRLRLQPSARLVASDHPVLQLWQAHQPAAALALEDVDWRRGTRVLVAQRALEVEFQMLSDGELRWLQALQGGATLAEACAPALAADAGFDLAAVLMRHLELGNFQALPQGAPP